MGVKALKHQIVCPICSLTREVGYQQFRRINSTGEHRCHKCASAARTAKSIRKRKMVKCDSCQEERELSYGMQYLIKKSGNNLCLKCSSKRKIKPQMQMVKCDICQVERALSRGARRWLKKNGTNHCQKCGFANRKRVTVSRDNNGRGWAWKGTKNISSQMLRGWQCGARQRGIDWQLSPECLQSRYEAQSGRCALSGLPLTEIKGDLMRMSLDRIDSSKPYVLGNIQFVGSAINLMKQSYSQDEFIHLCNAVSKHSGGDR